MNASELLERARVEHWPTSSIQVLADTQAGRDVDEVDDEPPRLVRPYVRPLQEERRHWRMEGTLMTDPNCDRCGGTGSRPGTISEQNRTGADAPNSPVPCGCSAPPKSGS